MKSIWMAALLAVALAQAGLAQTAKPDANGSSDEKKVRKTAFFDSDQPLTVTFTANLKRLRGDKINAPWRQASLTFADSGGASVTVPVRARTRGIWRRKMCEFPPLRLNFVNDSVKKTPFHGLDKPKLVNYCKNRDEYEQLILQELQLYRVYHVLTPVSHQARLLRLTYADSGSGKPATTRWAILLEEPDAMAARVGGRMFDAVGASGNDLEARQDVLFGVFQYMIGNTDFSTSQLHNVEIVARQNDGAYLPVAYDFDFAGAVNAPYATTDPKLSIRRVRDRLFRGHCHSPDDFAAVFAHFQAKKDEIYALYQDEVGKLLDEDVRKSTLEYFDDFYRTIGDPRLAKREIIDLCRGTI
jgi:hypothetical protein